MSNLVWRRRVHLRLGCHGNVMVKLRRVIGQFFDYSLDSITKITMRIKLSKEWTSDVSLGAV